MYKELRKFLMLHLDDILGKLGKEFDSNDFITAFRMLFPNKYADILRKSGSYRTIHTWFARWFLSELVEIKLLKKGDIKPRESTNRNPTRNHNWIKIRLQNKEPLE